MTQRDTDPSPLMVGQDTHVFYVRAESRKLRYVSLLTDMDSDLTCCWGGSRPYGSGVGVILEENDYYRCNVARVHHETKQRLPAGTYYKLVDLEQADFIDTAFSSESTKRFAELAAQKRVVLEALDPSDPTGETRLQFRFWSHDEDARNSFEKINNQMAILAIAATGL